MNQFGRHKILHNFSTIRQPRFHNDDVSYQDESLSWLEVNAVTVQRERERETAALCPDKWTVLRGATFPNGPSSCVPRRQVTSYFGG